MGNEFPDGDLLSDVLLRSVCQINFQNDFQREKIIMLSKKAMGTVSMKNTVPIGFKNDVKRDTALKNS